MYALVSRYMPCPKNERQDKPLCLKARVPTIGVMWNSCKTFERKVPVDGKMRQWWW